MYYVNENDPEKNKKKESFEIEEKIDHYSSETADKIASLLSKLACPESLLTVTLIIGLNLTIFLMFIIVFSTLGSIFSKNLFGSSIDFGNVDLKNVSYLSFLILSTSVLLYVRKITKQTRN
jgi:hypothetical protein